MDANHSCTGWHLLSGETFCSALIAPAAIIHPAPGSNVANLYLNRDRDSV